MKLTFSRLLRLAPLALFVIFSSTANASGFGVLDYADSASTGGWACDTTNPLQTTEIRIYKGTRLVSSIQTGGYRPDVGAAGLCGGNEFTGFSFAWPTSESDGATEFVHAAAVTNGGETALNNSPAGPVTFPSPPMSPPACSSAAPISTSTSETAGSFRIYAYNVTNATTMLFPTWGELGGQDDLVYYTGVSEGNGTWHADVNLANHKSGNAEFGTFFTHVYVGGASSPYALCAATSWTRTAPPPPPPSGNASISAMAGPWPITIRTCDHDAGAICSLTWRNKEFIDDYDHGRQLQSASSFDGLGESFNPTEAGAEVPYNGINPSASSSRLRAISATNNVLTTETDMAFWRPVGGRAQSGHILNKQVKIGAFGLAHVIEYLTTFTIPVGEAHSSATFEVLTGYMPPEFDQFWTLDVKAGATNLVPLANANSEQGLPIIFSTSDGGWAMGIYSPDSPQPNYPGIGYGRWKYPLSGNIVKWNNVFRFSNPPRINNFRSFVIVGSLDNVRVSMQQLYSIVH